MMRATSVTRQKNRRQEKGESRRRTRKRKRHRSKRRKNRRRGRGLRLSPRPLPNPESSQALTQSWGLSSGRQLPVVRTHPLHPRVSCVLPVLCGPTGLQQPSLTSAPASTLGTNSVEEP